MIIEEGNQSANNKNGEVDEVKEIFALFDKNGDGKIPLDELGSLLRSLNRAPSQSEIDKISKEHFSSTGYITSSDIPLLLSSFPPIDSQAAQTELRAAFRVLDREGKGQIPSEELKRLMTTVGEKMTAIEADEMLKMADPEKTGFVDYEKFIQKLVLL
jgi:Ca2+-binding EF-hand superfamily protein